MKQVIGRFGKVPVMAVLHSLIQQPGSCIALSTALAPPVSTPSSCFLFLSFALKCASPQDDPDGANGAPSRKAWVNQLTVIKEVDFQRYVASRHVQALIDPSVCTPLPHGRDKWDLVAADMIADPELTN